MAILSSGAALLVPEFARLKAGGDRAGTVALAKRSLYVTLSFSCGCFALLSAFAIPVGRVLFGSEDAGRFILYLAPVVPVMFLDHIADAALKGIGEQVAVMWINIADSALTVLLILCLLPRFGIVGYILMIALTEVFNFALSLSRLMRKTGYRPAPYRAVLPLSFALLSLLFSRAVLAGSVGSVPALALGGTAGLSLYLLPFLLLRRRPKNAPRP